MNYPLIKRCFPKLVMMKYYEYINLTANTVTAITAADLERELEKAVRVYSVYTGNDGTHSWNDNKRTIYSANATHTALLIGIEPIKKETAEDLLREMATAFENARWADYASLVERAKALLERGEK